MSPLNAFPWVINGLVEAWVSTKRVNAFLQLKELNLTEYYGIKGPVHHTRSRDGLCSDGSVSEEATPTKRDGAVNVSDVSYHYFSPTGSVSGAAASCAISVCGGSFTWTKEDTMTPPDSGGPDSRSPDSRGPDSGVPDASDPHSETKSPMQLPNAAIAEGSSSEEGQTASIPWSLSNINITIKPVSSELLHGSNL